MCNKHIYTQNSKMSAGVKVSEPGMEGSVKNEEVFEAAKKMMGREFQTVLAALLKILPDYEDMLVKFILITPLFIVTLTIAHINLQSATSTNEGQVYKIQISNLKIVKFLCSDLLINEKCAYLFYLQRIWNVWLTAINEISRNMTYVKLLHIACPTESSYVGTGPGFILV